jgi:hypothetical protein
VVLAINWSDPICYVLEARTLIKRWLPFLIYISWCALIVSVIFAPVRTHAAQIDNVQVPGTARLRGETLHLNGYGLRTYSILGIDIYVAALYLEHLSTNAEDIIRSPETKLLTVRFEHIVSADEARKAWREGLEKAPCHPDPQDVQRFPAVVPAMHGGDNYSRT